MNKIKKIIITFIITLIFTNNIYANINLDNNADKSIYGSIKTNIVFYNRHKNAAYKNPESILFGVKLKTNKYNDIYTFATLLQKVKPNNDPQDSFIEKKDYYVDDTTVLAFVGINHDLIGTLTYGKNFSVIYDLLQYTNIFPYHTGTFLNNDTLTGSRNNTFTYEKYLPFFTNPLVKSMTLKVQYYGKNHRGDKLDEIYKANRQGWGIYYSYEFPYGLEITTSYAKHKRDVRQTYSYAANDKVFYGVSNKESKAWVTGFKYNLNRFYISTTFARGWAITPLHTFSDIADEIRYTAEKYGYANHSNNIKISFKYDFDSGLTPMAGYTETELRDVEQIRILRDLLTPKHFHIEKYFNVSALLHFNKNMYAYVDYKIDRLPEVINTLSLGENRDNILSIGLVYNF